MRSDHKEHFVHRPTNALKLQFMNGIFLSVFVVDVLIVRICTVWEYKKFTKNKFFSYDVAKKLRNIFPTWRFRCDAVGIRYNLRLLTSQAPTFEISTSAQFCVTHSPTSNFLSTPCFLCNNLNYIQIILSENRLLTWELSVELMRKC
jgi:uncharacterized protein YjiK